MKTLRLTVSTGDLAGDESRASIRQAAEILRSGGLVAFPTETVYGLGAHALDAAAASKIFQAKKRPAWDPLIVHISGREILPELLLSTELPENAEKLIAAFWPGPLTLLLPRAATLPMIVTAGRPLVGIRLPSHPVAHALLAEAGIPIAAPSANSFGRISPTLAEHVLEDLDGRIDAVLDAGEATLGLESTVVDPGQTPVVMYRPGMITMDDIRRVCGSAMLWAPDNGSMSEEGQSASPSPGTGLRHYAPRTRLVLIQGEGEEQASSFVRMVDDGLQQGLRAGIMLPKGFLLKARLDWVERSLVFRWGSWSDPTTLAHQLFAGLRLLDASGLDVIYCPLPTHPGIGAALRDRLAKAVTRAAETPELERKT